MALGDDELGGQELQGAEWWTCNFVEQGGHLLSSCSVSTVPGWGCDGAAWIQLEIHRFLLGTEDGQEGAIVEGGSKEAPVAVHEGLQ